MKNPLNRRSFIRNCSTGLAFLVGGAWKYLLPDSIFGASTVSSPNSLHLSGNRYLSGNYAPLPIDDERESPNLKIIGKIPSSLNGLYLRNGPNPIYPPTPYHWFDGDGMLHGVYLEGGKAKYINRFVRTEGWLKEKAAKQSLYGGLIAGPPSKNAANTSVIWHHQTLLAAWEGGLPYAIDPRTLETQGSHNFSGKVKDAFTAHPKIDPTTGELLFFWYGETTPHLNYGVLDKTGTFVHLTPLPIPRYVLMHDFAITSRYAVFLDLPLLFTDHGLKFDPSIPSRIGVVPRRGTQNDIRWFTIKPCWLWHVLNAFDSGDEVTLIAARKMDFPKAPAFLYRWTVNLKTGAVTEGALDDKQTEFPQVSPLQVGRDARYGYGGFTSNEEFTGVIKYDLKAGTSQVLSFGENRHGGETIFVPASPAPSSEDDGFLLNLIFDKDSGKSELLVLAANDPKAKPVARIILPRRVPYGLHGTWIPSGDMKS